MNKFIGIAAVALAFAAPVASFAQSNQPLTRAEVREQIVQLEKAGYNPNVISDSKYPADVQAAESARRRAKRIWRCGGWFSAIGRSRQRGSSRRFPDVRASLSSKQQAASRITKRAGLDRRVFSF